VLVPFTHCTTVHGRIFLSLTIKVNGTVPAVMVAGEMEVIVGTGSTEEEMLKGRTLESIPELNTPTFTISFKFPGEAISAAEMTAVSCVELTNVVALAERTDGMAGDG
jgi:hypothetical protein